MLRNVSVRCYLQRTFVQLKGATELNKSAKLGSGVNDLNVGVLCPIALCRPRRWSSSTDRHSGRPVRKVSVITTLTRD